MTTILIASLRPGEGRTTTAAGLGACLAAEGRAVRLLRLRMAEGADPAAEDDARALAAVPGCESPDQPVTETQVGDAADALCLVEAPPGVPAELAARLAARVVLVSAEMGDGRLDDLAAAGRELGNALLGVVATRQPERRLPAVQAALEERSLPCLAVLPEDRLLAGPTVGEMAKALDASRLVDGGEEDEAVEFVMLGPISADPGQPYFLQHGRKAVVNRFDKMDLHLAALATEPDCLILTGGASPSPYLLDRVEGSGLQISVLLSPEGTAPTLERLDELYGRTRFCGRRKVERATELLHQYLDLKQLTQALR